MHATFFKSVLSLQCNFFSKNLHFLFPLFFGYSQVCTCCFFFINVHTEECQLYQERKDYISNTIIHKLHRADHSCPLAVYSLWQNLDFWWLPYAVLYHHLCLGHCLNDVVRTKYKVALFGRNHAIFLTNPKHRNIRQSLQYYSLSITS